MYNKCKTEDNPENNNTVRTLMNIKINQTIQHASIYLIMASVYYKAIEESINTDSIILSSIAERLKNEEEER